MNLVILYSNWQVLLGYLDVFRVQCMTKVREHFLGLCMHLDVRYIC